MTPWIYEDTDPPVAKWGMANGEPAVMLDMPDGLNYGDQGDPGTDDWDGESAIFQGDKQFALRWLDYARASVENLPDEPTWPDGKGVTS